jgi:hypothetical protein
MQFPLRDFFWLTVVIGLAIGITIEHKRVLDLSRYEGDAQWWEKAARGLAEKFEQQTGQPVKFDARKSIVIMSHVEGQEVRVGPNKTAVRGATPWPADRVYPGYVRDTHERDMSWLTGFGDLDMILAGLVLGGPIGAISYYCAKKPLPSVPGIWDPHAPIWKHPWKPRLFFLLFAFMSVAGYSFQRAPFNGTLFLLMSVVWAYYYCNHFVGKPTIPAADPAVLA